MATDEEVQQAMQQFRTTMIDKNPMNVDPMDFRNVQPPRLVDIQKQAARDMVVAKATGRV